jgi:hypothetical protein
MSQPVLQLIDVTFRRDKITRDAGRPALSERPYS